MALLYIMLSVCLLFFIKEKKMQIKLLIIIMTATAARLRLRLPTRLMRYIKTSCTKIKQKETCNSKIELELNWKVLPHSLSIFYSVLQQQMQKHRRKCWGYCRHHLRKQTVWGIVLIQKLLWCWQRQPIFKHSYVSAVHTERWWHWYWM